MDNFSFAIRRILEYELGLKSNEIFEENIWELARKAEALKKGKPLETYSSTKFLNYSWDIVGIFLHLEQALDIEIFDEEVEATKTIEDLVLLLRQKLIPDEVIIHPQYFDTLLTQDKIKILIVGRDPYPNGKMGIPFCKTDIKDMRKFNCSGNHLLKGLGIDIAKTNKNPVQIFHDLLQTEGIGFVNASYFFIGDKRPKRYQVKFSNYINQPIFEKSEKIVLTKSAKQLLRTRDKKINDSYKPMINANIQMPIRDNWTTVCHPDNRNIKRPEHFELWQTNKGLIDYIESCVWKGKK